MPPKTRDKSKTLKENVGVVSKTKHGKVRSMRKALADKTNSTSDDNIDKTSVEIPTKCISKPAKTLEVMKATKEPLSNERPRRDRRLPSRFVENKALNSLLNKEKSLSTPIKAVKKDTSNSIVTNSSSIISPFKTPQKPVETSLITDRPRRICRLPSRFDDHFVSPNKYIPIQPIQSSTPKSQINVHNINDAPENGVQQGKMLRSRRTKATELTIKAKQKATEDISASSNKKKIKHIPSSKLKVASGASKTKQSPSPVKRSTEKTSFAVVEENAIQGRKLRNRKVRAPESTLKEKVNRNIHDSLSKCNGEENILNSKTKVSTKSAKTKQSPIKSVTFKNISPDKRIFDKKLSFRVLEDKNVERAHVDVYEFTYDPDEEPPPQKKKKKRVVKRKPAKPKTVVLKNIYDQNMNKALKALKNVVVTKQQPLTNDNVFVEKEIQNTPNDVTTSQLTSNTNVKTISKPVEPLLSLENPKVPNNNTNIQTLSKPVIKPLETPKVPNTGSVQVENIAADFESILDDHNINYSPVNSPHRPETPIVQIQPPNASFDRPLPVHDTDPLNLRNLSFFDDQPVASSSMNVSVRHPQASPWRVDFGSLPIKWHVGSYVKPNMTPAMECSFVNFDDNKKKHVYTNIVPQRDDTLPEITEKNEPNLVQTSIISFIKEQVEKSATKKQRGRSKTPTPCPCIFNEEVSSSTDKVRDGITKKTRNVRTPKKGADKNTVDQQGISDNERENSNASNRVNSREHLKRKNNSNPNGVPKKTPHNEKDYTFFGFDEEEVNQENVSPKKNVDAKKARDVRSRARAVLKEINEQTGPTRAAIPLAAKSKDLTVVNRLYEEMKSATDAPVFPENNPIQTVPNIEITNNELDENSQSVHLFEDIEFVHHLKPQRKSYGKAKKVTFRQLSVSDSDTQNNEIPQQEPGSSDEEDDLADLTFEMPAVEQKKTRKKQYKAKQKMTKKERAEAEAWAANFNSMCEDVEDFPLLIE